MRAKYGRARSGGDMLHCDRVKVFVDGVLETYTALMLEGYPDQPANMGAPLFTADEMNEIVRRADRHGLQVSTHAIGDGGVRRTLDAYENAIKANGRRDSRHRIEHIEMIDPADINRLKELGVLASLQPIAGVGVPGVEVTTVEAGERILAIAQWVRKRPDTKIVFAGGSAAIVGEGASDIQSC